MKITLRTHAGSAIVLLAIVLVCAGCSERKSTEQETAPAQQPTPTATPETAGETEQPPPKALVPPSAPKPDLERDKRDQVRTQPAVAQPKTVAVKDVLVLTGAPLGGVRLEHRKHAERAGNTCTSCHHPSKPQQPATAPQQACSTCHTKVAAAPMKTKYQAAFHNPTAQAGTCIDCHKTENAKGKKSPMKCTECHKKEIQ